MIESIWTATLRIFDSMPWWFAAFLVGWFGSVGVTHPFKVGLRRLTRIDPDTRAIATWVVACLTALVFAGAYAIEQRKDGLPVMLVAIMTGLWSPLAFAGLQKFLRASPEIGKRKGFGWLPDLSGVADWLSGDVGPSKGGQS